MAPDVISFARGAPSADILPVEMVRESAQRALRDDWARALSYGTGRGHPALAEWIAEFEGVEPEQVMITNGSLEGGALLFDDLVGPGDEVIVEQPSYDRTLLLLARNGAERLGVSLEADGLRIAELEEICDRHSPKLAHVIPNFHNPAGCTLSREKRFRLLELAADNGFRIFEDDPYALVHFGSAPPQAMFADDDAGRVLYASSFSKTVSPGIRVGYLMGPAEDIARLAKRASENYISPNMLAESIVWDMAKSGELAKNIQFVTEALRGRRDALAAALREHLPEAEFVLPEGGYFLWVDMPEDVDAVALGKASKELGAPLVAGPDFMIEGGRSSFRLSFAPVPAEDADEGVRRIAQALDRVRSGAAAA
ncbi:PLP-dependent aminotransferase family protein [Thermoleophilia bacterium SCSIO 60948]|nr:PLP-dependent aminotransferase family protein [Thermoleophilia bacterium SCSIO 60948]